MNTFNTENIQEQLNKLPIIQDNFFTIKTKNKIDIDYAKTIIGNIIYFDWHHDGLIESISGKVLGLKDNDLLIYTNYVFMLDEDLNNPNDLENNSHIQNISINNISNIFVCNEYTQRSWETIPEDYEGKIYEITNIQGNTITALTYNCDTNLYMAIKYNNNGNVEIEKIKYPVSLIKSMKEICNK